MKTEAKISSMTDCSKSYRPSSTNYNFQQFFLWSVQKLELIGAKIPVFGKIYAWLFYKSMLCKEARQAELMPGQKVLHIGCGPLPMTALFLADLGARVVAMDIDRHSVQQAKLVVKKFGLERNINVLCGSGTKVDCSGFNAVWISLHVHPLDKTLMQTFQTMDPGCRLIFRTARGNLARFYEAPGYHTVGNINRYELIQPLGKKSIILHKTDAGTPRSKTEL
ncbi:class I SAM-dependent methyltransferase [Desulfonatronovibrio magnus]|uniref:class I SAM-dependent methyltransferase n=1 Tax=Desulfonatronovibrio magnus TaxID=698827 RepID=UPI0005EAD2CC|nr:nicotianamine synthase family protein [Desulfonatronovibrio magnus]